MAGLQEQQSERLWRHKLMLFESLINLDLVLHPELQRYRVAGYRHAARWWRDASGEEEVDHLRAADAFERGDAVALAAVLRKLAGEIHAHGLAIADTLEQGGRLR